MFYNIYLIFQNLKKESFSNFFKSLISFFLRSKCSIIEIIDFGKILSFKKNFNRLFFIKAICSKNVLLKLKKLFKLKNDLLIFSIILKKNINNFLLKNLFKNYLSKNFKLLPSFLFKIKFNNYKKIIKILKILKILSIIPNTVKSYLKKIKIC